MNVGSQISYSEDSMAFLRQMGVEYVDVTPKMGLGIETDGYWHADKLLDYKESIESRGLKLVSMHLPLSAGGIEHQVWPNIMLGTEKRDGEIEMVVRCIEAAAKAKIPLLLYNLAILPVVRTAYRTPGRGGVTYSHFDYHELKDSPLHPNGPVSAEAAWQRIEYFVEKVIPVAEEYKVKLGCHQHDPGMPRGIGFRGVERVLGSIAGVKRFIELSDSPYHGLNFCQGTVSEMCEKPQEVYDAIEYFGKRKRIFWVHFRNIRGGFLRFDEVFPDEGDIDMATALRTYKEAGYDGVFVADHIPKLPSANAQSDAGRAFCIGYIKALIQAVESEA